MKYYWLLWSLTDRDGRQAHYERCITIHPFLARKQIQDFYHGEQSCRLENWKEITEAEYLQWKDFFEP